MTDELRRIRAAQAGVLLDTNVLLAVLLLDQRARASEWKRTLMFNDRQLDFLDAAVRCARKFVTTPHVLTEVTNLLGQARQPIRNLLSSRLRAFINNATERLLPAKLAIVDEFFDDLGLADVAQALVRRKPIVVTADAGLTMLLEKRGRPVINVHHVVYKLDT